MTEVFVIVPAAPPRVKMDHFLETAYSPEAVKKLEPCRERTPFRSSLGS